MKAFLYIVLSFFITVHGVAFSAENKRASKPDLVRVSAYAENDYSNMQLMEAYEAIRVVSIKDRFEKGKNAKLVALDDRGHILKEIFFNFVTDEVFSYCPDDKCREPRKQKGFSVSLPVNIGISKVRLYYKNKFVDERVVEKWDAPKAPLPKRLQKKSEKSSTK